MVVGHTLHASLLPAVYGSQSLGTWRSLRGCTAVTFLFVAGAVLAHRLEVLRLRDPQLPQQQQARRMRRYLWLGLIGYGLRFPLLGLLYPSDPWWRMWSAFVQVDILPCIAVSLALLDLAQRRLGRRWMPWMAFAAGVALVLADGRWAVPALPSPWTPLLNWVSVSGGSLFPVVPFTGYACLGFAWLRAWLWLREHASQWLGSVALAAGALVSAWLATELRARGMLNGELLYRIYRLALVSSAAAFALPLLSPVKRLPSPLAWMARNSLPLYVVHVELVYSGSFGLRRWMGERLTIAQALWAALVVLVLSVSFIELYRWLRQIRRSPKRQPSRAALLESRA